VYNKHTERKLQQNIENNRGFKIIPGNIKWKEAREVIFISNKDRITGINYRRTHINQ
jgi:hypothetical protein